VQVIPPESMTASEFAVIVVVVVAACLGIAVVVQRRDPASPSDAAGHVQGMARVSRVVFVLIGVAALVVGLALAAPVAIVGGLVSILAGLGQAWVYRNSRR
jgi:hypothetical protein